MNLERRLEGIITTTQTFPNTSVSLKMLKLEALLNIFCYTKKAGGKMHILVLHSLGLP